MGFKTEIWLAIVSFLTILPYMLLIKCLSSAGHSGYNNRSTATSGLTTFTSAYKL